MKEVRIRPKIGDHDFEAKARSAKKLLGGGNKVKVSVFFRGREITHPDIGFRLLNRMKELLKEEASPERQPSMDGKRMIMILAPLASRKTK